MSIKKKMSVEEGLVIDNGSRSLRVGIAGEETPQLVLRSLIGNLKVQNIMNRERFFGDELVGRRSEYNLVPVTKHDETNWEKWEELMWHVCSKMNVESSEKAVLMTEKVMQSKKHREKMTQTMFETFSVPAFYSMFQEVASSFACGNVTSFVVSSGYEQTYLVPIFEGQVLPHVVKKLKLGGRHATEYLYKMLQQDGIEIPGEDEFSKLELVNSIKETLAFSNQYPDYIDLNLTKTFELPDKTKIEIKERHLANCAHLLFIPSLAESSEDGFSEMLCSSYYKIDIDYRRMFNEKFVMCGGNTLFQHLPSTLHMNVFNNLPDGLYRVKEASEGVLSSWTGGSIMASLSTFESNVIHKQEYEEIGPNIIHRKCF